MRIEKIFFTRRTIKIAWKKSWMVLLAAVILFTVADTAYAKWEVEYSDWHISAMRQAGFQVPKRAGSFATRAECERVMRDAVIRSGDPALERHMRCVGFDAPSHQTPAAPLQQHRRRTQETDLGQQTLSGQSEDDKRRMEEERQRAHDIQNKELLRSLKGTAAQSAEIKTPFAKTGQLQLKTYSEAGGKTTGGGALKQLESIAGSSADAAATDDLEKSRKLSEFEVRPQGGIPIESVRVPDVLAPTLTAAQIQARDRIIKMREALVSELLETQNKLAKTRERMGKVKEDITAKQKRMAWMDKVFNNPRIIKERLIDEKASTTKELDDLEKLALELEREAAQLHMNADKQRRKYKELDMQENDVLANSELAEEYLKRTR